jgi:hypothetical protein
MLLLKKMQFKRLLCLPLSFRWLVLLRVLRCNLLLAWLQKLLALLQTILAWRKLWLQTHTFSAYWLRLA